MASNVTASNGQAREWPPVYRPETFGELFRKEKELWQLISVESGRRRDVARLSASRVPSLPIELWWMIGSHMCMADRVCLSLAHRSTYPSAMEDRARLRQGMYRADLITLLLRLDRDLPDYRLCSTCVRLHPRSRTRRTHEASKLCGERYLILNDRTGVPWWTIQLVMKGLAYEDLRYGPPLSSLTRGWVTKDDRWSYQQRACVSSGHLLLYIEAEQRITRLFAGMKSKPRAVEDQEIIGVPSCHHGQTRSRLIDACKCALAHHNVRSHERSSLLGVQWRSSRTQGCVNCESIACDQCPNEWEIEVRRWKDTRSDGFLVVRRWIDLGPIAMVMSPEQFSGLIHSPYLSSSRPASTTQPFRRSDFSPKAEWDILSTHSSISRLSTRISQLLVSMKGGSDAARNFDRL